LAPVEGLTAGKFSFGIMPLTNPASLMSAERLAEKRPEIGASAPAWERWRPAGGFCGEAFPHPPAAGTAALPE